LNAKNNGFVEELVDLFGVCLDLPGSTFKLDSCIEWEFTCLDGNFC
jgi:hypothetical protein